MSLCQRIGELIICETNFGILFNKIFFRGSNVNTEDGKGPDKYEKQLLPRLEENIKIVNHHDVSFDDVIGLDLVKRALQESAILPLLLPSMVQIIKSYKGILQFGVRFLV